MTVKPHAANCRWATPTLLLGDLSWLDATDSPWSCLRPSPSSEFLEGLGGPPRLLRTTDECAVCPGWEARPPVT